MALFSDKSRRARRPAEQKKETDYDFTEIDYYANREIGRLNMELIQLKDILLDPTNPRTEGVDIAPLIARMPNFLIIDPNHENFDKKALAEFDEEMDKGVKQVIQLTDENNKSNVRALFEGLIPLRDNIRLIGVKQPIEIRKLKDRPIQYQITYGHRRYIASILAGEINIPARLVSSSVPANDKFVQTSENFMQEKMSLPQRIKSFEQLVESFDIPLSTSVDKVVSLTGYSRTVAYRYMAILRSEDKDLRHAIDVGDIKDLKFASSIARKDIEERKQILDGLRNEGGSHQVKKDKLTTKKSGKVGRNKTSIITPRIKNPNVIKLIVDKLNLDVNYKETDWDDLKSVEEIWHKTIKLLSGE